MAFKLGTAVLFRSSKSRAPPLTSFLLRRRWSSQAVDSPLAADGRSETKAREWLGKAELKRGDWLCLKCSFLNFSRNFRCRMCEGDGPRRGARAKTVMLKGDWACPECSLVNFARNQRCLECKAEGPIKPSFDAVEKKNGDWNCPKCEFMNFANNKKCLRCEETRPKRQLNPGEWECPSCDSVNYSSRDLNCRKCSYVGRKSGEFSSEYEEQMWTKLDNLNNNQTQFRTKFK